MASEKSIVSYNRFLLVVAGLGGLLYGVDVGIISGALPYLDATSRLTPGQLSFIVAAVLLGSVISTLFAGALADAFGRKKLMVASGLLFVVSIPVIALSSGFATLVFGRLLQGVSAGLIGVVVPLYLAECLDARSRGRGTGIFQWLLTLGIFGAALIGMYFSLRVAEIEKLGDAALLHDFKDASWRNIFWVSLPPGILFVAGSLLVAESPRWLHRKGRKEAAYAVLLKSRDAEQAKIEHREMESSANDAAASSGTGDSLLQRKYLVPFVLACVILACNQATGVNSILGYHTTILIQSGLSDISAHWGYVLLTLTNFLFTQLGVRWVDIKGRKFLLSVGSAGIIASLVAVGFLFRASEVQRLDVRDSLQGLVTPAGELQVNLTSAQCAAWIASAKAPGADGPYSFVVIYSYGDFRGSTAAVRSDEPKGHLLTIRRDDGVPANRIIAFFAKPFGDLAAARTAPLRIENALLTPVPSRQNGWLTAAATFSFMAFFAIGPGVCVWLALSELMPTRIRSNGMSIALLINQAVSTLIAGTFLPTVGEHGYSTIFFAFAGCTVVYFITAAFFLPETKGKTLEEIEQAFAKK